ncbi:DNA-processing protein DprA [Marinomonas algarum]|uniref:DNA-processing protein DprA n=1 Tax=Marinomonas algarum TaxID=2883105 RepID=A0A9X1LCU3_9GAMM|nr:DNA-processing protein DprA [Marinomonas algarum]MCB5162464.1 DNA-processing protein DprA [Marinomonas algarum]
MMMNTPDRTGLTPTDWLCLSFLSDIGPSRLSRLYTYLSQLYAEASSESLSLFDPSDDKNNALNCSVDPKSHLSFELLRKLKWPEVTARQAMAYLSQGELTKEQAEKRDASLTWLSKETHFMILQDHEAYPDALKEIKVAPAFLYVEGHLDALLSSKIGIVGARKCTRHGRDATFQLADQLSSHGIGVVSGGAMGIDTAAHQGALQSNSTPTVAVMGTGLLHRYPSQNRSLFEKIVERGALISEYPLTTSPRPHLFPPRNRIISGLSMGVLVAEASLKSGSLISASYAIQQNRDVFALPGRLTDAQSAGCHQLIRQGATLVRHLDDILDEYTDRLQPESAEGKSCSSVAQGHIVSNVIQGVPETASEDARTVATILEEHQKNEAASMDFDALVHHSHLSAGTLMQVLMELELCSCIENREGHYRRC